VVIITKPSVTAIQKGQIGGARGGKKTGKSGGGGSGGGGGGGGGATGGAGGGGAGGGDELRARIEERKRHFQESRRPDDAELVPEYAPDGTTSSDYLWSGWEGAKYIMPYVYWCGKNMKMKCGL
jgi:hypothetical protein